MKRTLILTPLVCVCVLGMVSCDAPEVSLSSVKAPQQPKASGEAPAKPPTEPMSSRPPPYNDVQSAPGCLRSKGGCAQKPQRLGLCEDGLESTDLKDVSAEQMASWSKEKRKVMLAGALTVDIRCEDKPCPADNPCCNPCEGPMRLDDGKASVILAGSAPSHYRCKGDKSMTCCGLDVRRQRVVVTGVLLDRGQGRFEVKVESLCEP